ncbi:enoyl-CoA hydratase/isomerase family protein [Emcibacter nanhaiensis]|uniref:Enoyl-CoA hydratase n=1 Tax=Emcibacter nanhaiensis TaxID=1505037 RepID=A0A501PBX4_9PROT|nr:enoyl-CoA hydratase-related protein [Emcibacter nanhaiensis]TPD57860.1 enoyl-CoA hydratase [Emcibacter nanhaiensis]
MDYKTLDVELKDNILKVTLNRPNDANSISLPLAKELMDLFTRECENPEIRAVVLTGAGKLFCAGGDLETMLAQGENTKVFLRELTSYLHAAVARMSVMNAPVIAAVNGTAAGAGMALACAADLAICEESSRFVLAYTKVGLVMDGSSSWYLPRIVGLRRAMELALDNRMLSSQEALDWGIINRIAPDGEVVDHAMEWAKQLANGPTGSFGVVKNMLRQSLQTDLDRQLEVESMLMSAAAESDDGQEGMRAFFEKRPPNFKGS